MSMRQILVLAAAALAAVLALFLVRGMATKEPTAKQKAAETVVTAGVPVLVALKPIAQGDLIQGSDLGWANFPTDSIGESFLRQSAQPQAQTELTGAVARMNLEKGEPITATKLVKPGEQGFMAAILEPGYRAVAVPISEETAAAGFILPNDHVDVILTRKVTLANVGGGTKQEVRSGVVLQDVRVLAIDQTFKVPAAAAEGPATITGGVATLELTPRDAETLAMADESGDVSLALRGVQTEARRVKVASARTDGASLLEEDAAIGSVRIHKFGRIDTEMTQAGASSGGE